MGHHDPLDGLITYLQLQATASKASERSDRLDLGTEIREMTEMCKGKTGERMMPLVSASS